jgi:hypothetical protein
MGVFWILVLIALLLLFTGTREHYVDVPGPGKRPSLDDAAWRSKVEAQIAIGASDEDYIKVLQSFYDRIYKPLRDSNSTASVPAADVEKFIQSQPSNINQGALRQIIISGFAVDRGETGAAREEKQLNIEGALKGFAAKGGSKAIEPKDGVDETWPQYTNRPGYKPTDTSTGKLPEGSYAPVEQQDTPRREGVFDDKSTSWTGAKFYSVCEGDECSKNVL